jgi:hypothetical protein
MVGRMAGASEEEKEGPAPRSELIRALRQVAQVFAGVSLIRGPRHTLDVEHIHDILRRESLR